MITEKKMTLPSNKTPADFLQKLDEVLEAAVLDMEIDYYELESFEYDINPCECYWDEDEEYRAKLEKLIEFIEADGWGEYLAINKTKWYREYLNETPAYERVQNLIIKLLINKF